MSKKKPWLIGTLVALGIVWAFMIMLVIGCFKVVSGIGHGDLTIQFLISDAVSEKPIENAKVDVILLDDPSAKVPLMVLHSDSRGVAQTTQRVSSTWSSGSWPFYVATHF